MLFTFICYEYVKNGLYIIESENKKITTKKIDAEVYETKKTNGVVEYKIIIK
jgi:hypothetical protein